MALTDQREALRSRAPSLGPISFTFTQFRAEILLNNRDLPHIQDLPPPSVWKIMGTPLHGF